MEDVMREFAQLATDRPTELRALKQDGKKVVAYIGQFVPEELLYAAGVEPYLLCRGGEPEPPEAVLDDMLRFLNPLARSIAGFHMMGLDPVMPLADLIVASQPECHIQRIAEFLEVKGLPVFKVGVPQNWDRPYAGEYYFDELRQLKAKLEELSGNAVTDDKLREYIGRTNEINALLRRIDGLRKRESPPLGGYDFIHLNHHSFFTEPQVAIEKLTEIAGQLERAEGKFAKTCPRLLLAGHAVAVGDYLVVKQLEDSGALIATEMLDEGIRWYQVGHGHRGRSAQEPLASQVSGQTPHQHLPAGLEGTFRSHEVAHRRVPHRRGGLVPACLRRDLRHGMHRHHQVAAGDQGAAAQAGDLLRVLEGNDGPADHEVESFVESLRRGR